MRLRRRYGRARLKPEMAAAVIALVKHGVIPDTREMRFALISARMMERGQPTTAARAFVERTESHPHELRDDAGQYAVGLDRLCVCGHEKGWHAAGRKGRSLGDCLAGTTSGLGTEHCDCTHFRAARIKR